MKRLVLLLFILINGCSAEEGCEPTPSLVTNDATDITDVSATISGTITPPTCDDTVTSQGFVYGKGELPTVDDNKVIANGSSISKKIENLDPNTTYYARVFFENPIGVFYSNTISFKTGVGDLVVETLDASVIFPEYVKVGVKLIDDGGGNVTNLGVYYSLEESVDKDDNFAEGTSPELINLNPNTTYFYKASGNNEKGQFFGEIKSFKTLDGDISSSINLNEVCKNTASIMLDVNMNYESLEKGIIYSSTNNELNISDNDVVLLQGDNEFNINNLNSNTQYYAKGYTKYKKIPTAEPVYFFTEIISFSTAPNQLNEGKIIDVSYRPSDKRVIMIADYYGDIEMHTKMMGITVYRRDNSNPGVSFTYLDWQTSTPTVISNNRVELISVEWSGQGYRQFVYRAYFTVLGCDDIKYYIGGYDF